MDKTIEMSFDNNESNKTFCTENARRAFIILHLSSLFCDSGCLSICLSVFVSAVLSSICLPTSVCLLVLLLPRTHYCSKCTFDSILLVCLSVFVSTVYMCLLSVRLFQSLLFCLSAWLSLCLMFCPRNCLSVRRSTCLSVNLCVYCSVCLTVCRSIWLPVCLCLWVPCVFLSVKGLLTLCLSWFSGRRGRMNVQTWADTSIY